MTLLSWEAPEFTKYKKGKTWFITFFLIAAGLIVLALFWKSITMIILIILGSFVVLIYALKEPVVVKIEITPQGVKVEDKLYPFSEIKSFWIFYEPPEVKEISFYLKRALFPNVFVPLGDSDPNQARKILLKFLPEKKHKESLFDIWARKLRF